MMSLTWVTCTSEESQRVLEQLLTEYEAVIADPLAEVDETARQEGYRLVNPRYKWTASGQVEIEVDRVERVDVG